jgi:hypothetical protein
MFLYVLNVRIKDRVSTTNTAYFLTIKAAMNRKNDGITINSASTGLITLYNTAYRGIITPNVLMIIIVGFGCSANFICVCVLIVTLCSKCTKTNVGNQDPT